MATRCIYCPKCGRKLASFWVDSTMTQFVYCRKCEKQVVWNPQTDEVIAKPKKMERNTSSGVTFW